MAKVTYLFGAGASCEAMPLVADLPQRMKAICEFLMRDENQLSKTKKFEFSDNNHTSKFDYQTDFINDLEALEKSAANHKSIDTYAKKIFATTKYPDPTLYRLKLVLSCYFTLEQMYIAGRCDSRYDAFWASLIGKTYQDLPENVRILTWNYDIQMELSYAQYCPLVSLGHAIDALNIHINNNRRNHLKKPGVFNVYKLNGTANFLLDLNNEPFQEQYIADDYKNGLILPWIENIIQIYSANKHFADHYRKSPTLSFAWELPLTKKGSQTSFIEVIGNEINDTEILVVIGYSFPFFNREVDRALIRSMAGLKKVYIQDIKPEEVISSFRSIREDWRDELNKRVEPISMKNQFFLPPEL